MVPALFGNPRYQAFVIGIHIIAMPPQAIIIGMPTLVMLIMR